MTRTLVLSTTFPQYSGDPRGEFILRHWEPRARAGERVCVLAPRTAWSRPADPASPVEVRRIAYAPLALSTLTGRFGMLENVRERPHRALLLPLLWRALRAALVAEIETERPAEVVAHMLLPVGWIVAEVCGARAIPYTIYGHGTDVDLALLLPAPLRGRLAGYLAGARDVFVPSEDKRDRLVGRLAPWSSSLRVSVETMSRSVVPPEVDPVAALPVQHADGDILFLGRLIRQKGVDDLLTAVSLMRPRPVVDIAGDGPERRRLERLAARLGVAARFHGFVQGDAKARLLRGASVVCVPSRETFGGLSEGAPLVIREAFAYGVPVVATRVGGIPELCRTGGAARLVPARRPHALSDALTCALSERHAAARHTAAAGLC